MSATDKLSAKEVIVGAVILIVVAIAMFLTIGAFKNEGVQQEAAISHAGAKKGPDHVGIFVKLLSFDASKGDAAARVEFTPSGNLVDDDGTLKHDLKFFVNSARRLTIQKANE